MKYYIVLTTLILLVSSCQDPTYSGDYFIRNNSNYSVAIYLYNKGKLREPIVIDMGEFN